MKHYEYINYEDEESIFYIPPCEIKRDSEKEIIAHSLGALLYMPALREQIAYDIINKKYKGLKSIALCLEDAIGDKQIEESERGITSIFEKLNNGIKSEKIDSLLTLVIPVIMARSKYGLLLKVALNKFRIKDTSSFQ